LHPSRSHIDEKDPAEAGRLSAIFVGSGRIVGNPEVTGPRNFRIAGDSGTNQQR
jgi:hypothetical protein